MNLKDFLLQKTKIGDLCAISDRGYLVATAYIDDEDLFIKYMNYDLLANKVVSHHYDYLNVNDENGNINQIRCIFIDTK